MTHANAKLTPAGRLAMVQAVVIDGWTQARVAERFQVARGTVSKWVARYRTGGETALQDHSSRPHRSPNQTPVRTERRIIGLRVNRRWGPHRIAYHLHLPQSTVSKVLARYHVPLLAHIDLNTGVRVRKPKPVRYEHEHPGDLVHVDVKKLGRIPDGGGWRTLGREQGNKKRSGAGYSYLHSAIDDHSRVAYSEILDDKRKHTAAGFWKRANAYFNSLGISVKRVLTDNGSCYRSHVFNNALGERVKHKYTRPYRPQTNGKIERFHRTLAFEWAYTRHYDSDAARAATYQAWIHNYNHHRPHTALGGKSPIDRVHNVNGKNS
ncbi:IS481 family transposase [Gulosibacter chungangensis]|uniref:IS481 family transposase n=1 Tax=Gulosibacter chungangensis TaxID=979746 RepID=A0A7J5BC43_9MICO|nr:IS481 family transposase [Gulosibacter chungangensis]KAB1643675.1 IS481 family transposase [Gulosibacter chungangensis]